MKHRYILSCICIVLCIVSFSTGCGLSSYLPDGFEGGETVTPDRLREIRGEVLGTAASEPETLPPRGGIPAGPEGTSEVPETDQTAVTDTQTDAHTDAHTDAQTDAQTVTQPDIDTDAPMPEGTVFWTPGGKVFHTDRSCYHLAKSTNVCSGSMTDAVEAGKTGLCSTCAKKAAGGTQD